jgi:hypothetical protein
MKKQVKKLVLNRETLVGLETHLWQVARGYHAALPIQRLPNLHHL